MGEDAPRWWHEVHATRAWLRFATRETLGWHLYGGTWSRRVLAASLTRIGGHLAGSVIRTVDLAGAQGIYSKSRDGICCNPINDLSVDSSLAFSQAFIFPSIFCPYTRCE